MGVPFRSFKATTILEGLKGVPPLRLSVDTRIKGYTGMFLMQRLHMGLTYMSDYCRNFFLIVKMRLW